MYAVMQTTVHNSDFLYCIGLYSSGRLSGISFKIRPTFYLFYSFVSSFFLNCKDTVAEKFVTTHVLYVCNAS